MENQNITFLHLWKYEDENEWHLCKDNHLTGANNPYGKKIVEVISDRIRIIKVIVPRFISEYWIDRMYK